MRFKTLFISIIAITFGISFSSCSGKKRMSGTTDDMYYSPNLARKEALRQERLLQRDRIENEYTGVYDQSPSSFNQNNQERNDYRMNYAGYFGRFGGGYRPQPRMNMGMMYSPVTPFWMGYPYGYSYGYSYGYYSPMMGFGNRMGMMYHSPLWINQHFHDPFNPWRYQTYYGGGIVFYQPMRTQQSHYNNNILPSYNNPRPVMDQRRTSSSANRTAGSERTSNRIQPSVQQNSSSSSSNSRYRRSSNNQTNTPSRTNDSYNRSRSNTPSTQTNAPNRRPTTTTREYNNQPNRQSSGNNRNSNTRPSGSSSGSSRGVRR